MNKLAIVLCIFLLSGCAMNPDNQLLSGESAVELRSYQSRAFDMTDQDKMLRTIIATLQDLGFVIDKADGDMGVVSATKLGGYTIRMSTTSRRRGDTQLVVRANATYNLKAIEDPEPYQNFYSALSKGLFLTAHAVD